MVSVCPRDISNGKWHPLDTHVRWIIYIDSVHAVFIHVSDGINMRPQAEYRECWVTNGTGTYPVSQ